MTSTIHPVANDLNQLADELNAAYFERGDLTRSSILALLSKEHVFALGAPGTAKTDFFAALAGAFIGARHFKVALSKTRPAEKVLGPLDIPTFRDKGDYRYKRKGFATDSELVTLDEIGKASPVLGHDLLALLNEREIHEVDDDGNSVHPAPLSTAFTASNEMLTDDSDDNAAIWDRLLYRVFVDYIQATDAWTAMLQGDTGSVETTIQWEDMADVIANVVPAVTVSDATLEALVGLRDAFNREQLSVSDRRWKASIKALKASAFLGGRDATSPVDIEALQYTLWEVPNQIEKVQRLCFSAANPFYEPTMRLVDLVKELEAGIDQAAGGSPEAANAYATEASQKLRMANDQIATLELEIITQGGSIPEVVEKAKDNVKHQMKRVISELMHRSAGLSEERLDEMVETLLRGQR